MSAKKEKLHHFFLHYLILISAGVLYTLVSLFLLVRKKYLQLLLSIRFGVPFFFQKKIPKPLHRPSLRKALESIGDREDDRTFFEAD